MKDLQQLIDILPQKYPFRMIDEIVEFKEGISLTAVKNITGDEWVYGGQNTQLDHYPETLIIEAAAQAALILYHFSMIKNFSVKPKYIVGKVKAEFLSKIYVGDQVTLHAKATKLLVSGGYSEIEVKSTKLLISNMVLFFSVKDE
ncbi:MAG TPA: hypothetical protein VI749_01640 [Candidatus Omnitrophota bacterium]|nr:hypothetical protein [Candidatus Omnitrophota bacterium]